MKRDPLLRPAFLFALAVLWLNDHWLKAAHPSWLTGKSSDFAGLFMLPIVIDAVLRRMGVRAFRWTLGITLLGVTWFVLANLWTPAELVFEQVFGVVRWLPSAIAGLATGAGLPTLYPVDLVADATDLIAVPMAALGLASVRRYALNPRRESASSCASRPVHARRRRSAS